MTREKIVSEFVRLSLAINQAEAEGLITREEAVAAIEAYRERADAVLEGHRQGERVKTP